jgi:hypothetical protein
MALTNAYEIATPSPRSCSVDSPVFGGTVAQFIDLTNHLALGRARRVIHANFTRQLPKTFANLDGNTDSIDLDSEVPPSAEVLEIPWLSSPMARYVSLFVRYRASGTPSLTAELYELNTTGGAHTQIDVGCEWTTVNGRLAPTNYTEGNVTRYALLELTTTAQIRAASGVVDEPRPLVVPAAYRGSELMIRLTAAEVEITSVDAFEIYEQEWS